jgi:hypothetical protein
MQAVAQEHASVDAFEEAVVQTTSNGFIVVCGLVACWSLSVSSLLMLSGQGSALFGQRTRPVAGLWRFKFINGPKQNWDSIKQPTRVAQHTALWLRAACVGSRQPWHERFPCCVASDRSRQGG